MVLVCVLVHEGCEVHIALCHSQLGDFGIAPESVSVILHVKCQNYPAFE